MALGPESGRERGFDRWESNRYTDADAVTTLAIEGDDLGQLVRRRRELGLTGRPNVAIHRIQTDKSLAKAS